MAIISALTTLFKLLIPLIEAYRQHEKEVVKDEISKTFERLKAAQTHAETIKALNDLDSDYHK